MSLEFVTAFLNSCKERGLTDVQISQSVKQACAQFPELREDFEKFGGFSDWLSDYLSEIGSFSTPHMGAIRATLNQFVPKTNRTGQAVHGFFGGGNLPGYGFVGAGLNAAAGNTGFGRTTGKLIDGAKGNGPIPGFGGVIGAIANAVSSPNQAAGSNPASLQAAEKSARAKLESAFYKLAVPVALGATAARSIPLLARFGAGASRLLTRAAGLFGKSAPKWMARNTAWLRQPATAARATNMRADRMVNDLIRNNYLPDQARTIANHAVDNGLRMPAVVTQLNNARVPGMSNAEVFNQWNNSRLATQPVSRPGIFSRAVDVTNEAGSMAMVPILGASLFTGGPDAAGNTPSPSVPQPVPQSVQQPVQQPVPSQPGTVGQTSAIGNHTADDHPSNIFRSLTDSLFSHTPTNSQAGINHALLNAGGVGFSSPMFKRNSFGGGSVSAYQQKSAFLGGLFGLLRQPQLSQLQLQLESLTKTSADAFYPMVHMPQSNLPAVSPRNLAARPGAPNGPRIRINFPEEASGRPGRAMPAPGGTNKPAAKPVTGIPAWVKVLSGVGTASVLARLSRLAFSDQPASSSEVSSSTGSVVSPSRGPVVAPAPTQPPGSTLDILKKHWSSLEPSHRAMTIAGLTAAGLGLANQVRPGESSTGLNALLGLGGLGAATYGFTGGHPVDAISHLMDGRQAASTTSTLNPANGPQAVASSRFFGPDGKPDMLSIIRAPDSELRTAIASLSPAQRAQYRQQLAAFQPTAFQRMGASAGGIDIEAQRQRLSGLLA